MNVIFLIFSCLAHDHLVLYIAIFTALLQLVFVAKFLELAPVDLKCQAALSWVSAWMGVLSVPTAFSLFFPFFSFQYMFLFIKLNMRILICLQ